MSAWKRWLPCRGYGWLVPTLPVAIFMLVFSLGALAYAGRSGGVILAAVATLLSTGAIVALGICLNFRPGRVSIDAATGRRRVRRRRHALLWIPMQWWGVVIPLLGVYVAVGVSAC